MTTLIPKYYPGFTNSVNRPFNEKLQEVVSVKDFGAVGDGVASDDVAVQKAIDYMYANNICTLYFPDGTYYFNQPVTILFDGVPALNSFRFIGTSTACMGSASNPGPLYSGSTITGKTGITSMFIFSKTDLTVGNGYAFECSNISFISGLGIGPLSAFVNYVGGYPARPFVIKNCYFWGFSKAIVSDITTSGLSTGICQVTIRENNFISGDYALYAKGQNAILDLDFSNNCSEGGARIFTDTGALGGSFRITDNLMEGQADAIVLNVGLGAGEIARNYFELNTGYLIYVVASAPSALNLGPNYITNCSGAKVFVGNLYLTTTQNLEDFGVKLFMDGLTISSIQNAGTLYTTDGCSVNLSLPYVPMLTSVTPGTLTTGAWYPNGGSSQVTPIGTCNVETITASSSVYPAYTFASGDWIVVMTIARRVSGSGGLYVGIYSNTGAFCGNSGTTASIGNAAIGEWVFVMRVVQVTAASAASYRVRWAVQSGTVCDIASTYVYRISTPTANVTPIYYCLPNF